MRARRSKAQARRISADGSSILVDSEDFDAVSARCWYAQPDGVGLVWWATKDYKSGNEATVYLGQFVLARHGRILKPEEVILHVDGDHANAQMSNLRVLVRGTANHRRSVPKRGGISSTDYIGVSQVIRRGEPTGFFLAKISDNYSTVNLGIWPSDDVAARAYDRAAKRMHGEFARLNFPT